MLSKRAMVFVDGQNLYYAAKIAFQHELPNYDIRKLSQAICDAHGWNLTAAKFYTGFPEANIDCRWNGFWRVRFRAMREDGVDVFSRHLRVSRHRIDGQEVIKKQEKGIDVRIALDVRSAIADNECDVAVIFSQDQDLSEIADEARRIAARDQRWIKIASAYPRGDKYHNTRGIDRTDWLEIDRAMYDDCLDERDYFPHKPCGTCHYCLLRA